MTPRVKLKAFSLTARRCRKMPGATFHVTTTSTLTAVGTSQLSLTKVLFRANMSCSVCWLVYLTELNAAPSDKTFMVELAKTRKEFVVEYFKILQRIRNIYSKETGDGAEILSRDISNLRICQPQHRYIW